ncbi:MAG: XdhC family protein [Armatimonadota bacterium]|nr:XdhC family protein [Armatimonadota bacterium]MDR7511071.1 XdhC family protein [Armatimonadota bacterium]
MSGRELADILASFDEAAAAGEATALATIIGVRGSTYRRAGAHLLISPSGRQAGNISGGCLEGDVAVVGAEVLASGVPRLMLYDLTADDDAVWGLGLGCNGAIEVFVEPARGDDPFWRAARAALASEGAVAVVTVVERDGGPVGARALVWPDGRREGTLGEAALDAEADRLARQAMRELRTAVHPVTVRGRAARLFVEVLHPPYRLVVCGAGHDAIPVVRLAGQLGWRVLVVDRREAFLTAERFPGATFVRTEFPDAGRMVPTDAHTFVLVMTHNYIHDRNLLRAFLPTPAAYLGMLGPRARTEKILRELAAEGVVISPERRRQIYGPVGLDIGSETPEEIALAALAEILAVARGRPGGLLRDRRGPIHEALDQAPDQTPATPPPASAGRG